MIQGVYSARMAVPAPVDALAGRALYQTLRPELRMVRGAHPCARKDGILGVFELITQELKDPKTPGLEGILKAEIIASRAPQCLFSVSCTKSCSYLSTTLSQEYSERALSRACSRSFANSSGLSLTRRS